MPLEPFRKLKTPGTIILSLTGSLLLFVWKYLEKVLPLNTKQELSTLYLLQLALSVILIIVALLAFIGILLILRYKKEKKEQNINIEYRRFLISQWRKMVHEISNKQDNSDKSVSYLLERHKAYYSLKPYLSHKTIMEIARKRTFIYGSTIDASLEFIISEIANLEKEWGLI